MSRDASEHPARCVLDPVVMSVTSCRAKRRVGACVSARRSHIRPCVARVISERCVRDFGALC